MQERDIYYHYNIYIYIYIYISHKNNDIKKDKKYYIFSFLSVRQILY
jgi:hypothetical protein